MAFQPRRFPAVAWLTEADLQPQGDVGTITEWGDEIAWGLWVKSPFGAGTDLVLTIHAIRGDGIDGGIVTAAVTSHLAIEYPAPSEPAQSNPRRLDDPGGD